MPNYKSKILFIVLCLFFFTSALVYKGPGYVITNKVIAGVIPILWALYSKKIEMPSFLKRYGTFIIYAFVLAFLVDSNFYGMWGQVKTMIQLSFLLLLVYNIALHNTSTNLKFISSLLFVYFLFAYFGSYLGIDIEEREDGERLSGVITNSNALGFNILYGLISCLYLLSKAKLHSLLFIHKYWYVVFIFFFLLLLPTGSRKAFISIGTLFLFFLYTSRTKIYKGVLLILGVLVPISAVYYQKLITSFQSSTMGQRIFDEQDLEAGFDVRQSLYLQAIEAFLSNPVFGIGFNQFMFQSFTRQVTHSYYMEILTGTGLVGFIILFGIYVSIFKGAKKLFNSPYRNEAIFILSFLLLTFIMSFGFSYHRSFNHWFAITFIFIFFKRVHYEYKKNIQIKSSLPDPG